MRGDVFLLAPLKDGRLKFIMGPATPLLGRVRVCLKERLSVSAMIQFHTADLRDLFQVIGSADRDLLTKIGVHIGEEFRRHSDEEEEHEEVFDHEDAEDLDWNYEEVEADSAKEIITKLIMVGLPADLSEDEAFAVQDFMATYSAGEDRVQSIDPEDVIESCMIEDETAREAVRKALTKGVAVSEFEDFVEWLTENDASHDLLARVQMLSLGRLPESEDPTFTDPEEAYGARFGYLYSGEAAAVCDELDELAARASEDLGNLPLVLNQLFYYCNTQSLDLMVIIEE
jgi:hypothetical protein